MQIVQTACKKVETCTSSSYLLLIVGLAAHITTSLMFSKVKKQCSVKLIRRDFLSYTLWALSYREVGGAVSHESSFSMLAHDLHLYHYHQHQKLRQHHHWFYQHPL